VTRVELVKAKSKKPKERSLQRRMGVTRWARVAVAVIGVLAAGASVALAQDVMVNYVPGTDFSKYKTYKWVEIQGARSRPDHRHADQAGDRQGAGHGRAHQGHRRQIRPLHRVPGRVQQGTAVEYLQRRRSVRLAVWRGSGQATSTTITSAPLRSTCTTGRKGARVEGPGEQDAE